MTPDNKPRRVPRDNPLAKWLRDASADERDRMAALAGTTTSYLYQIAGLSREPKVRIAWGIEAATSQLHTETNGRLPVVTVRQLAMMNALEGLA